MATILVNLYVDTVNVTQNNIDTTCTFQQGPGTSDENFTTVANVGDTIIWSGFPSNSPTNDIVNITGIIDTGGPNVFANLTTSISVPMTVTGTVEAGTSGPNGDEETYTLNFAVQHQDGTQSTFHIDPKIQVHPPAPPLESNLEPKEKLVTE